jgi:GT2 family glycosyltransferase
MGFLPYASSANMAVSAAAFRVAGGFDEGFADLGAAGEDVDLSWRLQLAGYGLHFESAALVRYRHRRQLGDIWRQNVSYGMADVLLYRRYRDHGLRPRTLRHTLGSYRGLVLRVPDLSRRASRGVWLRDAGHRWGRACGSLQQRVAFL